MKTHSESEINPSTLESLKGSSGEGAEVVGVSTSDDPDAIVRAVDAFVFAWQGGDRPSELAVDPENLPFALGSLWGEQLVRKFGWDWKMVTFHEHGDTSAAAVLSPDRSLAIYPFHFVHGCLQDWSVDATILLSYNMLAAGTMGQVGAGEYANVMERVHRIVPRLVEPPKKPRRKRKSDS